MPNVVTSFTFLFCPLGWAHGAFYWGAIQGQPAAYLLLVPPVATLGGLVFSIRRQNWIDDVLFDQDRLAETAGRDAGHSSTRRGRTVADIVQEPRGRMPVVQSSRPRRCSSTEAIERRLLGGQWLRGNDWVPWGPVDRFALVVLTPRERLLTECLHQRGSVLTWQSLLMLVLLVALGCAILFEPRGEDSPEIIPAVIVLCWGVTSLFLVGAMSGYHLLAPVGFSEVTKAIIKVGLMKCLCWLPLTVGFSLAVAARHDVPAPAAIGLGLLPVVVYLAWLPMGACFVFGPALAETARWPARLFNAVCLSLAFMASLVFLTPASSTSVVFAIPGGIVRVAFAAVLFAATGSSWVCCAQVLGALRCRSS
jgi:hypothetical protein